MANHISARKRVLRNTRRAVINGSRMSRVRTCIKKVELALQKGDVQEAQSAFQAAQPELHRSVAKGLIHKSTASRKLSRLSAKIKSLKNA